MELAKVVVLVGFWKSVLTQIASSWIVKNDQFLEMHNTECC